MNADLQTKYNTLLPQIHFLSRGHIKQSECTPPAQAFPQLDPRRGYCSAGKPFCILFSGVCPALAAGGSPGKSLQDQAQDLH